MREESYNGWTNYETWVVNLWLMNEESTYRECQESGLELDNDEAAEWLKEYVEDMIPIDSGLFLDLITSSLAEVDWLEIAKALKEE